MAREVDRTCRRYKIRPSDFCGIRDPEIAYDFDLAIAAIHRYEEQSRVHAVAEHNPTAALVLSNTI